MLVDGLRGIVIPVVKVHRSLHRSIWRGCDMRRDVRARLLRVAQKFIESLDVSVGVIDITLTGSLANFNYSSNSDIDLHVVIDFGSIDENEHLVRIAFDAKGKVWNSKHSVSIKGFDVECYVQDSGEPHHSTGVFSVLRDEWVSVPSSRAPRVSIDAVLKKARHLVSVIDHAISDGSGHTELRTILDRIKKLRQCGLDSGGEYSVENLVFKVLRRSGHLGKLIDVLNQRIDADLSL